MKNLKARLSGVFVPVVTPFTKEEIVYNKLRENIQKLNETGVRGYLALGSNGEFKSLSIPEKEKILKTIVEIAGEDKVILAGAGAESLQETVELTQMAADSGADFAAILTPHYFGKKMPESGLITFYEKAADVSKLPVLLYSAPGFTGLALSPEVVKNLREHPNIVGIKDSSSSNIQDHIAISNDKFYVLAGTISIFFSALSAGAAGGVLSMANYLPEACVNLFELISSGDTKDIDKAQELNFKLIQLNKFISGKFGIPGVKSAMDAARYFGGEPRLPLEPLNFKEQEIISGKLTESGLI